MLTQQRKQHSMFANQLTVSRHLRRRVLSNMPPSYGRGFVFGILFNILHFFYHVFVLGIIVIGLSMFWLPIIAEYKYAIELEISDYLGAPVSIEEVLFDPKHDKPYWILKNIRLKDQTGQITRIHLNELTLSLDHIESLRTIRFQPDKVTAKGGYLSIVQDIEGEFRVDGLKLPLKGFNSGAGRNTGLEFDFSDLDINWLNEKTYQQIVFADTALRGAITPLEIIANMHLYPPKMVGSPIILNTHLFYRGDDQQTPLTTNQLQWSGKFEVSGTIDRLEALPIELGHTTGLQNAKVEVDGEGIVTEGRLSSLRGNLLLSDAIWQDDSTNDISLALTGQWLSQPSGWKLDAALNDIRGRFNQYASDLEHANIFIENRRTQNQQAFELDIDHINLSHYLPMLEKQTWFSGEAKQYLAALKPRGSLQGLKAQLTLDANHNIERFLGKGLVENFSMNEYRQLPGINGLNAAFDFDDTFGHAEFNVKNSELVYSSLLKKPIPITETRGLLTVKRQGGEWNYYVDDFHFDNVDLSAEGHIHIESINKHTKPADISLNFKSNRVIDHINDYMPDVLPKMGKDWSEMALIAGAVPRGELSITGNLLDLPFDEKKTGKLYVGFDVDKATLKPLPGWPVISDLRGRVEFIDGTMQAQVGEGHTSDARFTDGKIVIDSFRKGGHITVKNLLASSTLTTMAEIISGSPLGKRVDGFFEHARFGGAGTIDVNVHAAFNKSIREKEGIDTDVYLTAQNGKISFPTIDQSIEKINTRIHINEKGIAFPESNVDYKGKPATIDASVQENGKWIIINLSQRNDIQSIIPITHPKTEVLVHQLSPFLAGEFDYQASVQLPSYSNAAQSVEKTIQVKVESTLKGLNNQLPMPLGKLSNQTTAFKFKAKFPLGEKRQSHQFEIRYGDRVHALLKNHPKRVALHFGDQQADLPLAGIDITGQPHQLDVLAWKSVLESLGSALKENNISSEPMPIMVNLMVNRLLMGQQSMGQAQLTGEYHSLARNGRFELKSNQMAASLAVDPGRVSINANGIDLDWFIAKESQLNAMKSKVKQHQHPGQHPALTFTCRQCQFKNMRLDEIVLDMPKQGRDALIRQFKVDSEHFTLQARGHWKSLTPHQSQTQLIIDAIDIPQPNQLLADLGHELGIKGAATSINGQLQWDNSPLSFSLSQVLGELYVNIHQGSIPQIDPGAGKLLGLLNFSHLGKRLQLNFSDISADGIGFDSITGNLQFNQGRLSSDDIVVKSSVMLAGIKGETDLIARTLDHKVTVIPDIKSALPVVGVLFGGIGIGAAVAVIDQITDSNQEEQLNNENVGMRYHIRGSWDNPQIDQIQGINNDDLTYEDE